MVNMTRYKTYKIEQIPSEKFPEMVVVTKGKTVNKKFINETKAKLWIDELAALKLINGGARSVKKELDSIGFLVEEPAW
jgi:hypothetical protein